MQGTANKKNKRMMRRPFIKIFYYHNMIQLIENKYELSFIEGCPLQKEFARMIYKNIQIRKMASKEQQLQSMVRIEQRNQLSSDEEEPRQQNLTRSEFRKPIRNPFSDDSDDSDSDLQQPQMTGTPFPPKPKPSKSALQQAQFSIKWDKNQQFETQLLSKLEGTGMKDKKIRELASRHKALNIAYQKEKTMRKGLEAQLNDLMKVNEEARKSSKEKTKHNLQKSMVKSGEKCQNCQENQKKVMEFRLKSQNIKIQLNKAMRVIEREIGQNFNIEQVLNGENAWKGRQQKIDKLKSRVKQLEDKLQTNGINVSHMSGFTQAPNANQTNAKGFNSTRTSALIAENKRKQFQNMKVQVQALKNENQLLQGKIKSLTSRKVILENELKQTKQQFEKKKLLLMEKSENDDKFISLLKIENQKLKKEERVVTKVIYKEDENSQLKKQVQMLRKKLKNMSQQIENRKQAANQPVTSKSIKRQISSEKQHEIEEEYLRGGKYLKKMTPEDEDQIYRNWKNGKQ